MGSQCNPVWELESSQNSTLIHTDDADFDFDRVFCVTTRGVHLPGDKILQDCSDIYGLNRQVISYTGDTNTVSASMRRISGMGLAACH